MTTHSPHLFLVLALISLMSPALAASGTTEATPPDAMASELACHMLMTEQECGQFKTAITQLTPGPTRDSYLAEHKVLMQEREAACSCNRKVTAGTYYLSRRQAMLRF
jgi:hypothetical protein